MIHNNVVVTPFYGIHNRLKINYKLLTSKHLSVERRFAESYLEKVERQLAIHNCGRLIQKSLKETRNLQSVIAEG